MTRTIATSTHPPIGSRAIYDDRGYIYNKVWYNIDLFYQENINYNYTIVNYLIPPYPLGREWAMP